MNNINKIFGYCRISTKKQSLQRQIDNIKAVYPDAEIVAEIFTGTTADRPKWKKLLKVVKSGDTIVFDSVSRMSRNADEGYNTYRELYNKGVDLVFLKEMHINTSAMKNIIKISTVGNEIADLYIEATNKVLDLIQKQNIRIAFEQSEKEVTDLHTRTAEGMRAKNAGAKISKARTGNSYETQKSKQAKEIIKKHSKTFGGSLSDAELQTMCGISRNTLYKYKSEIKAENKVTIDD